MQTTGNLIGILVELTTGMQLGHDDLGGGHTFFPVDIGRNTTAIVTNRCRSIAIQLHQHQVTMTGQGFIDGVIDHLIDHVMQTGSVIGIPDIHARSLAHRFQALQDLDGFGTVFFRVYSGSNRGFCFVGHSVTTSAVTDHISSGATRASSTLKNCARPIRPLKSARSVPVIQA